jgi:hypothetical protein
LLLMGNGGSVEGFYVSCVRLKLKDCDKTLLAMKHGRKMFNAHAVSLYASARSFLRLFEPDKRSNSKIFFGYGL